MSQVADDPSPAPQMDPQLFSILTSAGQVMSTAIATAAATHGIIPADAGSQASLANAVLTIGGFAVTAGLAWWKTRKVTPTAMIQQVNGDKTNGVKVVKDTSAAVQVNAPVPIPPAALKP